MIPDAEETTIEFTGLVTGLPLNITAKDAITNDITIQINGAPVIFSGLNSGSGLHS